MTPVLSGVDHIHVNVSDRVAAEKWYQDIFGFKRVEPLMSWATKTGPLTVEDPSGSVHLAIFERENPTTTDAVAFGATGSEFLLWKDSLEEKGLTLRIADHSLAYSLYFSDPWGNSFEITTYERDFVVHELRPAFAEFGIAGAFSAANGPEADFSEALRSRQVLAHLRSEIGNVAHLLSHFDNAEAVTQAMIFDLSEELGPL